MVGAMAETVEQTGDDLVLRARAEADALGQLYDLYYERIFRFCVHRLFSKEVAEDVTSAVFLAVAERIRTFTGKTSQDFRNWLYAIAANQANSYIRKTSRRRRLLSEAVASRSLSAADSSGNLDEIGWPTLYAAVSQLKPEHQTLVTLRFFENLGFEQIGQIMGANPTTLRVTLHRVLSKLRKSLQGTLNGDE